MFGRDSILSLFVVDPNSREVDGLQIVGSSYGFSHPPDEVPHLIDAGSEGILVETELTAADQLFRRQFRGGDETSKRVVEFQCGFGRLLVDDVEVVKNLSHRHFGQTSNGERSWGSFGSWR